MPYSADIVDCVRTAGGRKNGRLAHWHPGDLGAVVVDELVTRTGIDASLIDDVIFGCVSQVGAQSGNIGRNVVLSSNKVPESVPGTTVDRQCGSSQQAIHFAAQAVMSGVQDVVVAGGVESMTQVPIGASVLDGLKNGHGQPQSEGIKDHYNGVRFSQFDGAEITAKTFKISREEMDEFGYASHVKAAKATQAGLFKNEIVPIKGKDKKGNEVVHDVDEGIRFSGLSLEKMKNLRPLRKDGVITAGTSSQICDGAAALLFCNEQGLAKLGVKPRARIVSLALAGTDPIMMLAGPIPASKTALKKANLAIENMDVYEVNEAFASVPLAWAKELNADLNKLNVNGGAMALGHPLGGTGAKLMTTLVNELERRKGKYALQAICEGGGTANATIIERCEDATAPTSKL